MNTNSTVEAKTSTFSNGIIWFGAAVSIAEIATGALLAPLGLWRALCATVAGHLIGASLFFFAGLIGARTGRCAMDTVKLSFGRLGASFFSAANIVQLIGWTSIMIMSGACAAAAIFPDAKFNVFRIAAIAMALIIAAAIIANSRNFVRYNVVAMALLFILTLIASLVVTRSGAALASGAAAPADASGALTFAGALELSIAMPLSWLPLVSDYTRNARRPLPATAASAVAYFLTSCWMYAIGICAALYAGSSEVGEILRNAGLPIAGLLIVILSTTTTTYLDVFSVGPSSRSIFSKLNEKACAIAACAIGLALALFAPVDKFEGFLYFIGSVFAPMVAILLTDYFISRRTFADRAFSLRNAIIWVAGFVAYRWFMTLDLTVGSTVPTVIFAMALAAIAGAIEKRHDSPAEKQK